MVYLWIVLAAAAGAWAAAIVTWHWPHKCCMPEAYERNVIPQPTISTGAMKIADNACRAIDDAMCEQIWAETSVRNGMGMAHVGDDEMAAMSDLVRKAAFSAIASWKPQGAADAGGE